MSFDAILWALDQQITTDPTMKLVFVALARHAKRDGTAAWPSLSTVAEIAHVSERTAMRHIQALESMGLVRRGDQLLVSHLRADRRPIVYDIVKPADRVVAEPDDLSSVSRRRPGLRLAMQDGSAGSSTANDLSSVSGRSPDSAGQKSSDGVSPVTRRNPADGVSPMARRESPRPVTGDAHDLSPVTPKQVSEVPTELQTSPLWEIQSSTPPKKPVRARDLVFEAVVEVCGLKLQQLTVSERGRVNKAVRELKAVDATPQDIRDRAARFHRRYRNAALTAQALTANWSSLARPAAGETDPSYWRRAES